MPHGDEVRGERLRCEFVRRFVRDRPACRDAKLQIDMQPDVSASGARPFGEDASHARQDVFGVVRAAQSARELRQDLVRCCALPVDQPVGDALAPATDRLERERHRGCGDPGEYGAPS